MRRRTFGICWPTLIRSIGVAALIFAAPLFAFGQQASVSAWDAAHFRIWGYIPYWATTTEINTFDDPGGLYTHVSDVISMAGLMPDSNGNLGWGSSTYQTRFNTLRAQAQAGTIKLQLCMFEVLGGQTDATWNAINADPVKRANFVTNVKNFMTNNTATTADDLKGFNFDWERPATGTEWGNYTQLARELRAAFDDSATPWTNDWEVSVCDYGSTDSDWDNTSLFDAKVYDQLMMMVYHIGATSSGTWADTKKTLTQQGAAKAFSDNQIGIGVGTYGDGINGTTGSKSLSSILAENPNLAYDATTYTNASGTWSIESRKQVREKTQLAIDRGMPGMFTWTIHYDSAGKNGLHRVMQHYMVVKKDIPDLDLDGKVNATDATTLANNMGTSTTNTGMTTALQFENYYQNGNWEKGDRDGNGFINQADADWLAGRYTALGVTLPDRLAYSGTFETFTNAVGTTGRWRAGRNAQNKLVETGNFKQEATNFLSWSGTGVGASKRSNSFVTVRNQNSTETAAGVNGQARNMQADLSTNFDTGTSIDRYVTFLVRENTAGLSATQLASSNRKLTLDFLDSTGATQFDFALLGLQQQFAIDSVADTIGQDVARSGFSANTTYLFVGKISGNGRNANTMQASLFPTGSAVANFTDPMFPGCSRRRATRVSIR
jgi:hypothetical protein